MLASSANHFERSLLSPFFMDLRLYMYGPYSNHQF
nr:MAG TPA: hypothetical protein [Caudoviricetes sp.]